MTLVKYTPVRDLWATQSHLNRIIDGFFGDRWADGGTEMTAWQPTVDVEETKDAFVMKADLPGMNKQDIQISVEDNRLTIRGERKSEVQKDAQNFHRVERTYGSFCRSFTLPATVVSEKVEATYKDGVLEVSVPKAEEVKPRQISIK